MNHIRRVSSDGSRYFRLAILTCLLSCALGVSALAGPEGSKRHFKIFIRPEYPELARHLNIKGTVRVRLLVRPDGRIRKTKVLGGSPLLVRAVVEAIRKWKYEEADEESVEIVRFDFHPSEGVK